MRFIPVGVHAVLDYLSGLFVIASPWLLGFAAGGPETQIPVVVGSATIIYSLFTDYRLGVLKTLTVPFHLILDAVSGTFLAVSPWLLGFAEEIWWPHLLLGLIYVIVAGSTEPYPRRRS